MTGRSTYVTDGNIGSCLTIQGKNVSSRGFSCCFPCVHCRCTLLDHFVLTKFTVVHLVRVLPKYVNSLVFPVVLVFHLTH